MTVATAERLAYALWVGAGLALLVDVRADAHFIPGVMAIMLAIVAMTVHVRAGQVRVAERIGFMIAMTDPNSGIDDHSPSGRR